MLENLNEDLYLRNCRLSFVNIDNSISNDPLECEDENIMINSYSNNSTYYNKEHNITLNLSCYGYDSVEDLPQDTTILCNAISEKPYDYLIEVLNISKDITVNWNQIEGTTSDYTIHYNDKECISPVSSYKYTEIKDGIEYKLNV